jgi:hypothetical protein
MTCKCSSVKSKPQTNEASSKNETTKSSDKKGMK